MTDEHSPPRNKQMAPSDPYLLDYLQIQDEINKMKGDLKTNMNNMTEKLIDLKVSFLTYCNFYKRSI